MTSDAYRLRTAGYTVLRGAVPAGEVAELSDRIDALAAEDDRTWGADRLQAMGQRGALRNLADRGQEFERLLGNAALHELTRALVGDSYVLHSYDALVLQPGEGRFPWDFHTDVLDLRGIAFPASITPGLNCLVCIDGAGPHNGATWLVPGSHRSVLRSPPRDDLVALAVQPALRPGDLLLFDVRIWHCAGHNASAGARRLIKMEFVQRWLRTPMDYSRSVRPEVLARLPATARAAIGEPAPASVEEFWRTLEGRP
jgi:ectoine hydroxylase-related dioxygenase (phytanoyl-CoA dioxygenase family)